MDRKSSGGGSGEQVVPGHEPPHAPCPYRALTVSHLATSPSRCLRRSTASGLSPRPSPRPLFMKKSPIQASRTACPKPAVPSPLLTTSWTAAARRAGRRARPPTGERQPGWVHGGGVVPRVWSRRICGFKSLYGVFLVVIPEKDSETPHQVRLVDKVSYSKESNRQGRKGIRAAGGFDPPPELHRRAGAYTLSSGKLQGSVLCLY